MLCGCSCMQLESCVFVYVAMYKCRLRLVYTNSDTHTSSIFIPLHSENPSLIPLIEELPYIMCISFQYFTVVAMLQQVQQVQHVQYMYDSNLCTCSIIMHCVQCQLVVDRFGPTFQKQYEVPQLQQFFHHSRTSPHTTLPGPSWSVSKRMSFIIIIILVVVVTYIQ